MKIRTKTPLKVAITSILILVGLKVFFCLFPLPIVLSLSASMPRGFYLIVPVKALRRESAVAFPIPQTIYQALQGREWLKKDAPLLKPIGALPGDSVCVHDHEITINGMSRGAVFKSDYQGLPLPRLRGCFVVSPNAFFPLSTHTARSFDGRYFGEMSQSELIGEAVPILTW